VCGRHISRFAVCSITRRRDRPKPCTKNNPKASPFRKRGFPLYDAIAAIVEGVIATGVNVFAIGGAVDQSNEDALSLETQEKENEESSENGLSKPEEVSDVHWHTSERIILNWPHQPSTPRIQRAPLRAVAATPLPLKRKHREDHLSGPQALSHLARSINNLAAAATEDPATPVGSKSPERRKRAWMVIVEEEDLSDSELALVPKIFRGRADVADEYLAFLAHKKVARCLWLDNELANVQAVE
jgi:hypothetical protein